MHRFYLPDLSAPALSAVETHHCRHVLRLKTGDELTVFDGRGHEARCRLAEAGKLEFLQHANAPTLHCRLTLAPAVTKRNMDWIIQKANELGVAALAPLVTDRTIVRAAKPDRWREIAVEACKQSGNNWLPEIHAPVPLTEFLENAGAFDLKLIAALAPGTVPLKSALKPARSALVLIGPEGDFTSAEVELARAAGCAPVSLGPLTLRAETAALYALSVLRYELQAG